MERKSSLCTFCLELQKQLDMQYFAPPLPVDIGNSSQGSVENKLAAKTDIEIGATSAVSDAPFISSDNSVVSMDEATASIARLFQAQRGK